MAVRLEAEAFDPGHELNAFSRRVSAAGGAVASFLGQVRSDPDQPIVALTLEHYPALARRQLEDLEATARTRFALLDTEIIHRHGRLRVGEPIVLVLAAAPHRHDAFDGAGFIMDVLKTDAPFWKSEERSDGTHDWVQAREKDTAARTRWDRASPADGSHAKRPRRGPGPS